jgi:NhaP-type Na+/H+ or K+/H+ antiporter
MDYEEQIDASLLRREAEEREFQVLKAAHGKQGVVYKVERFGIRCARILSGVVLFIIGAAIIGAAPSVSDTPFAALTLGALVGCAAGWMFGLLFMYWGFIAAFGAAPTRQEIEDGWRQQAAINVHRRPAPDRTHF